MNPELLALAVKLVHSLFHWHNLKESSYSNDYKKLREWLVLHPDLTRLKKNQKEKLYHLVGVFSDIAAWETLPKSLFNETAERYFEVIRKLDKERRGEK